MKISDKQQQDILEVMAFQEAAERAQQGLCHRSSICRLPVGSWQADMIRQAQTEDLVTTPADLRHAMENPDRAIIFLSHEAMVTEEIIERICVESSLGKMIVWETDAAIA